MSWYFLVSPDIEFERRVFILIEFVNTINVSLRN